MSTFYKELFEINSDAIVILTIRDTADKQAESVMATTGWSYFHEYETSPLKSEIPKEMFTIMTECIQTINNVPKHLIDCDPAFDEQRKAWLIKRYEDRIAEVKAVIPADQLIIFNCK